MNRFVFADERCTLWLDADADALADRSDAIRTLFGIPPADGRVLLSGLDAALTVLRGAIEAGSGWLRIAGGSMAMSPRSSPVARRVVLEAGLTGCERKLTELPGDVWRVPGAEMLGQVPGTPFHGTSTERLASIRANGLMPGMEANWDMGDQGGAHGEVGVVSLAAEAHVAAMHAYETAGKIGGDPVVLEVAAPADLIADHDVIRMIGAVDAGGEVAMTASVAAGLFATTAPIAPAAIVAASVPRRNVPRPAWIVIP